jgi:hypothetical protein
VEQRVAAFHEAAARFAVTDRVVQAASGDEPLDSLYLAREELAREAAGLLFARLQTVPGSREVGRLSTRRLAALREITNLTLAIARVNADAPSPERVSRILTLLMDTIDDAADSVLPPETAARFKAVWRERIEPQLGKLGKP